MYCADVGALTASKLTNLNKNTTHRLYGLLRARVVEMAEGEAAPFTGSVVVKPSVPWEGNDKEVIGKVFQPSAGSERGIVPKPLMQTIDGICQQHESGRRLTGLLNEVSLQCSSHQTCESLEANRAASRSPATVSAPS